MTAKTIQNPGVPDSSRSTARSPREAARAWRLRGSR